MTPIAQITALVDAHVRHDDVRFRAITLQIAEHLALKSLKGADQLRSLIETQQATAFVPLPSANGLLSAPPELASIDDMVLSPEVRTRFDRVVLEHTQRDVLFMHRLQPTRKLLFTGPPGVGKTMAASALAREVGLPMFRVELHNVIASHLGESASNLGKVFDHVRQMPALYMFDEFDAIALDRKQQSDGSSASGEMRRVVNSLLQFIEDDRSNGLIVAATNLAQDLDHAIFRRFDEVIPFAIPSQSELVALVNRVLVDVDGDHELDFDVIYAAAANPRLGHADVCAALRHVLKDHLMAGTPIDTDRVVAGLARRVRGDRAGVAA